jgi:hypothetical protein
MNVRQIVSPSTGHVRGDWMSDRSGQISSELADFRQFLEAQIASGQGSLSPEGSVRLWRATRASSAETVEAIRESLAELDACAFLK